ncbi:MAG: hypothetical protein ACI8QC_004531 [Planctomycetota bacterium]|jgi:hypothetical protein
MLTALMGAALLLAPLQKPAQATATDPAIRAWNDLAEYYVPAAALDLDVHFQMDGDDQPYRCQIRLAQGLHGSTVLTHGEEIIRFVGNGKGYYVLNEGPMTYLRLPDGYLATPVVGYLGVLRAWAGAPLEKPSSLRLIEAQPVNPLVRVLEASFEGRKERLSIGPDNRLLAASLVMQVGAIEVVGHVTFSRAAALNGIDVKDFTTPIPEGYSQVKGDRDLLLPVGLEAPDVTLYDLDGNEFQLDDLRGKTVLLDFWFYT